MPHVTPGRPHLYALRRELPQRRKGPSTGMRILLGTLASAALFGAAVLVYRSMPPAYETVPLTRGSIEVTHAVDGLVVRQERVYTAPADGLLRRLVPEGQRVRVGTPIAQILDSAAPAVPVPAPQPAASPGDVELRREIDLISMEIYTRAVALNQARGAGDTARASALQIELDQLAVRQQSLAAQLGQSQPQVTLPAPAPPLPGPPLGEIRAEAAGVVLYSLDGLESRLAQGTEGEWKPSAMASLSVAVQTVPDQVRKGMPVLKVVDNLTMNLLAVVPAPVVAHLGEDRLVTVRFTGRDGPPVTARVTRQVAEGGDLLLTLTAPVLPEDLVHQRRFRATLVLGAYEGLLVPRTALDVRGGLQGVWVLDGLEPRFHPVRVLGGNGDLLALETDLGVGVRVLRTAPAGMR